ncbi:hypothetical protein L1994_08800 [Methanomicrobium antiquum]|uniref:SMODS and SLOG-associating 2TM effector domain-containing protein n=1 Tax=Methanomicrobium antiquum TaxID=487686 RepID=A0AAF0FLU0_9EURY|nr:hypothetical protein [Methanomicrobium antiquum]MDD3976977.1 hypothetical protein [Methanomicrobium sp.]WFN36240.1 hypothetical protein L1994_08800 [Methanomicrobium antiquum]
MSKEDYLHPFPKSLPAEINIGIVVKGEDYDKKTVNDALRNLLEKLEYELDNTPATYNFILPFKKTKAHQIVEDLILTRKPDRKSPIEVILAKMPNEDECQNKDESGFKPEAYEKSKDEVFLDSRIRYSVIYYDTCKKDWKYDPIYHMITEKSNIVFLAGDWTVDSSKFPEGGIFSLAKHFGTTIAQINPEKPQLYELEKEDLIFKSYRYLNQYNSEKLSRKNYERQAGKNILFLQNECKKSGLPEDTVKKLYESMIPHFTRSKMLSKKYMRLYAVAGMLVSFLAALAVFTITIQTLFFYHMPELVWLEVLEIALILILMAGSRYGGYHRRWIDYNFFTERIRAAFFLYVACINCKKPDTPPHMSLAHRPNDWMVMGFESIVKETPLKSCRIDNPFGSLKSFFLSAWIDKRLDFYKRESKNAEKNYKRLSFSGEILFIMTLILATIHAAEIGYGWEGYALFSILLAALTITLPAFAAAIASIRIQREFLRNSERYTHIAEHIESIKNEVMKASDMNQLRILLEEMNEVTLREQQDWRIIFKFREIEAA